MSRQDFSDNTLPFPMSEEEQRVDFSLGDLLNAAHSIEDFADSIEEICQNFSDNAFFFAAPFDHPDLFSAFITRLPEDKKEVFNQLNLEFNQHLSIEDRKEEYFKAITGRKVETQEEEEKETTQKKIKKIFPSPPPFSQLENHTNELAKFLKKYPSIKEFLYEKMDRIMQMASLYKIHLYSPKVNFWEDPEHFKFFKTLFNPKWQSKLPKKIKKSPTDGKFDFYQSCDKLLETFECTCEEEKRVELTHLISEGTDEEKKKKLTAYFSTNPHLLFLESSESTIVRLSSVYRSFSQPRILTDLERTSRNRNAIFKHSRDDDPAAKVRRINEKFTPSPS